MNAPIATPLVTVSSGDTVTLASLLVAGATVVAGNILLSGVAANAVAQGFTNVTFTWTDANSVAMVLSGGAGMGASATATLAYSVAANAAACKGLVGLAPDFVLASAGFATGNIVIGSAPATAPPIAIDQTKTVNPPSGGTAPVSFAPFAGTLAITETLTSGGGATISQWSRILSATQNAIAAIPATANFGNVAAVGNATVGGTLAVTGSATMAGITAVTGSPAPGDRTTAVINASFVQQEAGNTTRAIAGTSASVSGADGTLLLAPTGTFTLTLLTASTVPGRQLRLRLTTAFAVNSASANVVPLVGGAATAAILSATAGKFALLQSDGTSWHIVEAN